MLLVYQLILVLLGFTLFRVITIDYPTASDKFLKCLTILQIYQIFLEVHFLGKLFGSYDSLKNIWQKETPIEIQWIHELRIVGLIIMATFTFYLTFLITL